MRLTVVGRATAGVLGLGLMSTERTGWLMLFFRLLNFSYVLLGRR